MFVGVKAVFIDEISMLSSAILQQINYRLQQITGIYDKPFGDIHVILCGDFRQLPPQSDRANGGHVAFLTSTGFRGRPPTPCGADLRYAKLVFPP
ncbi:unnamed protein product [Parnassius mnemosyne]|uniref:ATP-dependent DNA helicase n=1 Tax=Parnassius mnemosyne TaxID=213953 RepID=A0AAV1KSD0_9NEOP